MSQAVRVRVTAAQGSTPRAAGASMLVTRDRIEGTIGGGQLEWQALQAARKMLDEEAVHAELRLSLGPALRQCCGGKVLLSLDAIDRLEPPMLPADAPRALLFGAGHVGRAILHVLSPLPWHLTLVDQRAGHLPASDGRRTVHLEDDPLRAAAAATAGAAWVVATHSHDLDLDIVDAALKRGDFRWLGLIGSATKRRTFERRLAARGHAASAIARLTCPMGLPAIRDKHPAAIAVAVAAELLSLPEEPAS